MGYLALLAGLRTSEWLYSYSFNDIIIVDRFFPPLFLACKLDNGVKLIETLALLVDMLC